MADPGDPKPPFEPRPDADDHDLDDHDLDDLIGFTSASSLAGRERPVAPMPIAPQKPVVEPEALIEPEAPVEADPIAPEPPDNVVEPIIAPEEPVFVAPPRPEPVQPPPQSESWDEPEPDLFTLRPRPSVEAPAATLAPPAYAEREAAPTPAWAVESPAPAPVRKTFGRAASAVEPPEGAMSLYTSYALILFAVPTLGVSALIALFAITSRTPPTQALAFSHHVFQKRTLWISAIAAALGVVLIAVNLGVFVLFILAVWVVVRGAAGILALSANRPIARPRHWLI